MSDGNGWTVLMWAAQNGHTGCVKLLLEKEEGIRNSGGMTALMLAVWYSRPECVKLLLEEERDLRDSNGKTALDIARNRGYKDIATILEGRGS